MFALMLERCEVQKLRLSRPAEAGLLQFENSRSTVEMAGYSQPCASAHCFMPYRFGLMCGESLREPDTEANG